MANHKWKDESFSKYQKEETCVKCGVWRSWVGGDMQCWDYWWPRKSDVEMVQHQLERPECAGKIKTDLTDEPSTKH